MPRATPEAMYFVAPGYAWGYVSNVYWYPRLRHLKLWATLEAMYRDIFWLHLNYTFLTPRLHQLAPQNFDAIM